MKLPKQGIEQNIVDILKNGSLETSRLLDLVLQRFPSLTLQGIYKAVRILKKEAIIVVQKKIVALNQVWLEELERFAIKTKYNYRFNNIESLNILGMKDGDRIIYHFKDPVSVDIFWNHTLFILFDCISDVSQWYAYASHNWFLFARRGDELKLIEYMKKRGITYNFFVPHKTALDKVIRKEFDGRYMKYSILEKPLFRERKNPLGIVLNIFGDYVLEAQYDRNTTNRIEEFYRKYEKIDEENVVELKQIVSKVGEIKFMIEKNKQKAEKINKMFHI